MYHRFISREFLKSYIASNHTDALTFSNVASPADIPIITKQKQNEIYKHVLDNLTDGGKEAMKDIQPWIFNTLVDWSPQFEAFVCSDVPTGRVV